jgi:tRNA-Thr(GGU) m(6)t(6)A37 methyltransferase TsaA
MTNMELPEVTFRAIGTVKNEVKEPAHRGSEDRVSEIIIDPALSEALDDLEKFSHIIVLYWIHRSRKPAPMKVHPRGDPERAMMGVFATRSPSRPNPIGKATVKLQERQGNVLKVQGLDAIDGTPVLDIKPYIPGYDSVNDDCRAPSWMVRK